MALRDGRADRQSLGHRGSAERYQMRQKLVSVGDDYWIENQAGERVFHVDGRAFRVRDALHLEDAQGTRLCTIRARAVDIRDTLQVDAADGQCLAVVHRALISPLRERWTVDLEDSDDWSVQGNVVGHEYGIEAGGKKVAVVSKKWFRVMDTYGVEIAPPTDPRLVLAVTIAVDTMTHPV